MVCLVYSQYEVHYHTCWQAFLGVRMTAVSIFGSCSQKVCVCVYVCVHVRTCTRALRVLGTM